MRSRRSGFRAGAVGRRLFFQKGGIFPGELRTVWGDAPRTRRRAPGDPPMATDAQIAANRKNAARSTGPKTEEGKARARCNALKHGERARVVGAMPVLPHEDPRELERR